MPVVMFLLAAALGAQDEATFLAAYDRFAAATGETVVPTATAASDRFLELPPGAARNRQLVAGARASRIAGRSRTALDLATEARDVAEHAEAAISGELVREHLLALAAAGTFASFVDRARADLAAFANEVHDALAATETQMLPRAEQALRSGDTARGRFVFAELAAIEPPAPWRLANFALCLRQLGEYPAARAVYERGRKLWPDDLDLANDHGLLLRASGDLQGAVAAFRKSHELDLARPDDQRRRGPAITNLVHLAATRPEVVQADPLPDASRALALRPDAAMLARVYLDVALDRLAPVRRRP
ncbi:MAG: hypothetical protein WBO45_22250 [Planctomycetota bacterium]